MFCNIIIAFYRSKSRLINNSENSYLSTSSKKVYFLKFHFRMGDTCCLLTCRIYTLLGKSRIISIKLFKERILQRNMELYLLRNV